MSAVSATVSKQYFTYPPKLGCDRLLSTYMAAAPDNGEAWINFSFGGMVHDIRKVTIYGRFYTGWWSNSSGTFCQQSESNWNGCLN